MQEGLLVQRLTPFAVLPSRATPGSAGYDLSASKKQCVPALGKALVATDLAIVIPAGHYGRIAPRSSLALRNDIAIGAGVIDSDYRGAIGVLMFNHGHGDFVIEAGARIAQLILERISTPPVVEVDDVSQYETQRGAGGFGSTG